MLPINIWKYCISWCYRLMGLANTIAKQHQLQSVCLQVSLHFSSVTSLAYHLSDRSFSFWVFLLTLSEYTIMRLPSHSTGHPKYNVHKIKQQQETLKEITQLLIHSLNCLSRFTKYPNSYLARRMWYRGKSSKGLPH